VTFSQECALLENSLCEKTGGEDFRLDETTQSEAVHMEEEDCDDISSVGGVALGDSLCRGGVSESFCCDGQCAYDCVKVDSLPSAIEGPSVAIDLCERESRDITEEYCCCEGIYKLNEVLMRERCSGISGNACELASLEEAAMEEWIFSSDDEDEADDVRVCALDGLQATYSDFRNGSPAGVIGGSEWAE